MVIALSQRRALKPGIFRRFHHRTISEHPTHQNHDEIFQDRLSKAYGRPVTEREAQDAKRRLRDFFTGLRRCKPTQIQGFLHDEE